MKWWSLTLNILLGVVKQQPSRFLTRHCDPRPIYAVVMRILGGSLAPSRNLFQKDAAQEVELKSTPLLSTTLVKKTFCRKCATPLDHETKDVLSKTAAPLLQEAPLSSRPPTKTVLSKRASPLLQEATRLPQLQKHPFRKKAPRSSRPLH